MSSRAAQAPDIQKPKIAPVTVLTDEHAESIRGLAKGGALQIGGQMVNRFLGYVFIAVVVRLLGVAGYGLYRQIFQILTIGTEVGSGGFQHAAIRFIARARARGDAAASRGAFRVALIGAASVSTILFLGLMFFPTRLASLFVDSPGEINQFSFLLRIGAAYVPLYAAMQVFRSATLAYKTVVPAVLVGNVVQPAARLIIGVALIAAGLSVTGAVTGLMLSAAFAAPLGAYYYRRMISAEERAAKPKMETRSIVRWAAPQAGVALFGTSSLGLGIILLGIFGTNRDVGLFGIATSLQLLGNVFLTGIVSIWSPVVVDLYERGQIARLGSLYQTINRWLATLALPLFAMLILQPDFFARILAGDAGAGAAPLVGVLAIGNIIYVGTGPSGYLLSMSGRSTLNFVDSLIGAALYVGLAAWIVPEHGAMGMAIVDTIVTAFVNLLRVAQIWVLLGIKPLGRTYWKPVVATLVAAAAALGVGLLTEGVPLAPVIALAAFGLVYLAALKLMGLDPEERHVLDTIKARFRQKLRS